MVQLVEPEHAPFCEIARNRLQTAFCGLIDIQVEVGECDYRLRVAGQVATDFLAGISLHQLVFLEMRDWALVISQGTHAAFRRSSDAGIGVLRHSLWGTLRPAGVPGPALHHPKPRALVLCVTTTCFEVKAGAVGGALPKEFAENYGPEVSEARASMASLTFASAARGPCGNRTAGSRRSSAAETGAMSLCTASKPRPTTLCSARRWRHADS